LVAVWAEGDALRIEFECESLWIAPRVPNLEASIPAVEEHPPAIRTEANGREGKCIPANREDFLLHSQIPDARGSVKAQRRQPAPIGTETKIYNRIGVSLESASFSVGVGISESNRVAQGKGQLSAFGTKYHRIARLGSAF
jgi:hypothetical protein